MKDRKKDRHRPGYVAPTRQGRKVLAIYIDPELSDNIRKITLAKQTTVQDAMEQLCQEFVRRNKTSLNRDPS
jgi:hypothetical protein